MISTVGPGSARVSAGKLDAVQALRAFAALMVVVGHVIGATRHHPATFGQIERIHYVGGAGVDIFFLISGFIMVYATGRMFGTAKGSRDFMLRRVVRIAPLYWGMTVVALALLVIGHKVLPSAAGIAASFAFLPYDTLGRSDGLAFPIVDLGWTLNYEMMFYVVFALFIPLGRGRAVAGVAATMLLLVVAGSLMQPLAIAPRVWTQPIILEFVAGTLVALSRLHGRVVLGIAPRVALIVAAVAIYLLDPFGLMGFTTTPNGFARVFGWGGPSLLLLLATVGGPTPLNGRAGRAAVLLGDASYALYLLHPLVIVVMLRIAGMPLFPATGRAVLFVVTTVTAACIGAILLHKLVERPVTQALTRWLQHRGAPIGGVPLPPDSRPGG